MVRFAFIAEYSLITLVPFESFGLKTFVFRWQFEKMHALCNESRAISSENYEKTNEILEPPKPASSSHAVFCERLLLLLIIYHILGQVTLVLLIIIFLVNSPNEFVESVDRCDERGLGWFH